MSTYIKYGSIAVLALLLGWFCRSYYSVHVEDRSAEIIQVRENSSIYKFINPLILVTDKRDIEFEKYNNLKQNIQNYINHIPKQDKVEDISVYFRNLNSSEWEGVNEEALYAPASMLKVSVLMAYLKLAESDPKVLEERIYYSPKDESGQNYKTSSRLVAGYHTVRELLNQMIIESDNDAMLALDSMHVEEILKIYDDLNLPDPLQDALDFMSPKAYSRLFRALYNGSYISKTYSEEALKLLSRTRFNNGLTAQLSSTTVSHKFGELTNTTNGIVTERELHDCGIVYLHDNPYFLCIMTRGQNFANLQKVIADISKITFDYISQKNETY
jgi:beta-lactamase class A